MASLFIYYLIIWEPLGFLVAFLGVGLEGDFFLFTFAFLSSQGFFNPWLLFLVAYGGAVAGDFAFYFLGVRAKIMPKPILNWVLKLTNPFVGHLQHRPLHSLLLAKITYGLHKPIIVRLGMLGLSFGRFLLIDLVAVFIWLLIIGGLGYFSGLFFYLMRDYLHYAEIGILIGLVVLYFAARIIKKYSIKNI